MGTAFAFRLREYVGGREESLLCSAGFKGNLQLSLQELITWKRQNTANPGQEQPVRAGNPWQGQGWREGPSSLGLRCPRGVLISPCTPPKSGGSDMLSRLQNLSRA